MIIIFNEILRKTYNNLLNNKEKFNILDNNWLKIKYLLAKLKNSIKEINNKFKINSMKYKT